MFCSYCKLTIEKGRERLGLTTCLVCGDREAQRQTREKSSQTGPAYNKGPTVFMGGKFARQNALDAGRKTSADYSDFVADASAPAKSTGRVKKKIVGTMWYSDKTSRAIYEGEDLGRLKPARYVFFGDER